MAGWHHRLDGREFGWTLGVGDGQGGLACCNSWSCKESDKTEPLNWTEDVYRFMTMLCKQLILFYVLYISICLPSLSFSVILYPSIYLFLFVDSSPHSALHFFPSSLKNLFYWSIVDLPYCVSFRCSVLFSSVSQLCPALCNPVYCSTPGLPVHHQLPEFTQTHVHRVSDAIQPSHPLSPLSPPAPNPSQHQSLFQWVSPLHEVDKVLEFQL